MKLAISNIAWTPAEEPEIAKKLQQLGVRYVEIAPTKVWENPLAVSDEQITEYVNFWGAHDIEVVAFQSMLFPRPDLKLFADEGNRAETLDYLKAFIGLAGKMDVGVMVFGSPKNRQRGNMPEDEANSIAKAFFNELGNEAQKHDVRFCIEPNAPQYACDFVTTAQQGIDLVNTVHNPGFGLHLDIACMTLAGDDPAAAITNAGSLIQHFHVSSPMLESVEERTDVNHEQAGKALRDINYDKFVSIEMRPEAEGTNLARVERAIALANKYYNM